MTLAIVGISALLVGLVMGFLIGSIATYDAYQSRGYE